MPSIGRSPSTYAAHGKLPSSGIPRVVRPRKKLATTAGFSIVDPGGNWLRVYRSGDTPDSNETPRGLALALRSAARQGDARGDDAAAAKMLDAGLARHAGAPPIERVPALVYRAELAVRMGDLERARATLTEIWGLSLDDDAQAAMAPDLATAAEIERDLPGSPVPKRGSSGSSAGHARAGRWRKAS